MKDFIKNIRARLHKFSSSNFAKVLTLAVMFLLLIGIIFAGSRPYEVELREGDISLDDIYAPYDFAYPGNLDEKKTTG